MSNSTPPFSKNLRFLFDACLLIIFLTSSFDTVFNLKISGFTVRICTLLMLLFSSFIFLFWLNEKKKKSIQLIGFWSFLIWMCILIASTPNSLLISRGIGYTAWLIIFFFFILAVGIYIRSYAHYEKILIWYLRSFTVIGIMAFIQLIAVLLGFNQVISYYFMSGIPRIHGFSYEPSYFSTYLMIPWTFHFFLYFTKNQYLKQKTWNLFSLLLLTMIILLSFSRMGILLMGLIVIVRLFLIFMVSVFRQKIKSHHFYFFSFALGSFLLLVFIAIANLETFISLFEGLPFFSRYAHSASIRMDSFFQTWQVFINSPWYGHSLGGIAPAIAKLNGHNQITQEIVKQNEGLCVFLEILAASGIIGFIFFMLFLKKILFSAKALKKIVNSKLSAELSSKINIHQLLIFGLIAQLLLLCLNQNILRNYLWVHLALLNVSFFILKQNLREPANHSHESSSTNSQ